MNSITLLIVTTYPLNNEPVIRNRLEPFINVAIDKAQSVILVSPDKEPFPIDHVNFNHVCSPDSTEKPKAFVSKALHEIKQVARLIRLVKRIEADEIMITVPSMFLLFSLLFFPKKNIRLDVRDLTWEYLPESSFINRVIKSIFRALACVSLKRARSISVTNISELKYVKNVCESSDTLLVTNGVSLNQFNKLNNLPSLVDGPMVVSYIGNVGLAQDLTTLVDAAAKLPNIRFNIVGAGTDFEHVSNYVEKKSLNNVNLLGRISWEDVVEVYSESHVLYAQLTTDYDSAVPSKLYEYLVASRYVVFGGGAQAADLLAQFEHYTLIKPQDAKQLIEALTYISVNTSYNINGAFNQAKIFNSFIREKSVSSLYERWNC